MEWKLFATLAETAGSKEITVEVDAGATIGDALEALLGSQPDLREGVLNETGDLRDHIQLLHNGEDPFVDGDGFETILDEDDELALFPPVSGG